MHINKDSKVQKLIEKSCWKLIVWSIKCERKLPKESVNKSYSKTWRYGKGPLHCQNYFENVDMIGNSLGFLFERVALLNSFVTL